MDFEDYTVEELKEIINSIKGTIGKKNKEETEERKSKLKPGTCYYLDDSPFIKLYRIGELLGDSIFFDEIIISPERTTFYTEEAVNVNHLYIEYMKEIDSTIFEYIWEETVTHRMNIDETKKEFSNYCKEAIKKLIPNI